MPCWNENEQKKRKIRSSFFFLPPVGMGYARDVSMHQSCVQAERKKLLNTQEKEIDARCVHFFVFCERYLGARVSSSIVPLR